MQVYMVSQRTVIARYNPVNPLPRSVRAVRLQDSLPMRCKAATIRQMEMTPSCMETKTFQARMCAAARRLLGVFGAPARVVIALSLVTYVFVMAAIDPVIHRNPPSDELTWVDRSLMPEWTPTVTSVDGALKPVESYASQYYYAIHHPTVARFIYRTVLHASGVRDAPKAKFNYSIGYDENLALGNYLPPYIRLPLRFTNAVLVYGALIFVYFGLLKVSGRPLLTALALMPIVKEPSLVNALNCVIAYIGTDAALFFMMALFWFAWISMKRATLSGVLLLGILGGLTASTKYNGAIVLVAAIVCFALSARGWYRVLWPSLMGAVALTVFVLLNPVYTADGPRWALTVFKDTIAVLTGMQASTAAKAGFLNARWELLTGLFPFLPFTLPAVALLLERRREWWFSRTILWSAGIILGNLAVIMVFLPTYAAPVRIAFELLILAAGLSCLSARGKSALCRPEGTLVDKATAPAVAAGLTTGGWFGLSGIGLAAVGIAVAASLFMAEMPTGILSAVLIFLLTCGTWLILRSAPWTVAVIAPLIVTMPWRSCPATYEMMSFSIACAIIWLAFVVTEGPGMERHRNNMLIAASALAIVVSLFALVVLVPVAVICILKSGKAAGRRLAAALLAPPVAILLIQWGLSGQLRIVAQWNDLIAPPNGIWSLATLSDYVHGERYSRMIVKFGQGMYWAPAIAFSLWALRAKRARWHAVTFGGAAMIVAGTLLFGERVYFQWSIPLQMALVIPFGLVAVDVLRSIRKDVTATLD